MSYNIKLMRIECSYDYHTLKHCGDSYIAKFVESFVPKQFQEARKSLVEERRNKMLEQNERSPRNFRIRNRIESKEIS